MPSSALLPTEPMFALVRRQLWQSTDARRWFGESAKAWAVGEWRRRRQRQLFRMECHLGVDRECWRRVTDQFWSVSVAVFSESSEDGPLVGVCHGIGPGFLGPALHIAHFGSWGSTTCIDPRNVWEMFALCDEFQEPPGRYDDDQ